MTQTYTVNREEELLTLLNPRYPACRLAGRAGFGELPQQMEPMGENASKLSYHVGRLQELGLLLPAPEGQGRGQHLRAVAQRFVLSPVLFPVLSNESLRPMLEVLCESFLSAARMPEPDPSREYLLMDFKQGAALSPTQEQWRKDRRGLTVQQFHLSPERYAALMTDLQARIAQEVQASQETGAGLWHTVALLGFPGVMLPMSEQETQ